MRDAARANAAYRAAHAARSFPDPRLVFEVAGHPYLESFDQSGAQHAARIAALIKEGASPDARVLEWGCGPARILAHLPALLPEARFYGCDPDERGITFAQIAHPNVEFRAIATMPPTPYEDHSFDIIYGISVLTHLSETNAHAWSAELTRLISPDGSVFLTSHGDAAAAVSLDAEARRKYDAGAYTTAAGAREGSRTFASYFNQDCGRELFARKFADVHFWPAGESGFGQDLWKLRGAL